ncbi:MAG: GNAT family N-acetyltransferase [Gammaproteobacteria bacterium]|nr:GNAT family N-acetyltransferase [Gammaproteobacteria bacterium]
MPRPHPPTSGPFPGEYVFDWASARAYREHGIAYYPKLLCSIPFTPVTARKLLVTPGADELKGVLASGLRELAAERGASSVHALFLDPTEADCFAGAGYLARHDSQFHWFNEGYRDFDDFLARFTSKKRKNVRAERRKVREAGVTFRWIAGEASSERDWLEMYDLYRATIADHGGMPYLTREFFLGLPRALGRRRAAAQGPPRRQYPVRGVVFPRSTDPVRPLLG